MDSLLQRVELELEIEKISYDASLAIVFFLIDATDARYSINETGASHALGTTFHPRSALNTDPSSKRNEFYKFVNKAFRIHDEARFFSPSSKFLTHLCVWRWFNEYPTDMKLDGILLDVLLRQLNFFFLQFENYLEKIPHGNYHLNYEDTISLAFWNEKVK